MRDTTETARLMRVPRDGFILCIPKRSRDTDSARDDVIGIALELSRLATHTDLEDLGAAALELCKRHGPLGVSEPFRDANGLVIQGESLKRWADEGRAMWTAVRLLEFLGLLKGPRKEWWLALVADPC